MRVGLVTACWKPVINGVTRMVDAYKNVLESKGHEVALFAFGEPDAAGEALGVVRSRGIRLGQTGYYFAPRPSQQARHLLSQMDIVHCHHLFMSLELAHRYAACPIVYTNHTRYDLYTHAVTGLPQAAADGLMRRVWPAFARFADVVVAPSAGIERVMGDFGMTTPIEVIDNGIDLTLFNGQARSARAALGVPDGAILAIYVGRLAVEKNVAALLRQFKLARATQPALHLLLVGDGPAASRLRALTAEMGLGRAVTFLGAVPYAALPPVLAAADFFVTASVSEVHPLSVLEAMACGLAVVGVHSPGISDTIEHGKTGLLAAAPDGLAVLIRRLAEDEGLRMGLGRAAKQSARRYDIRRTVDQSLALYRRLLRERPDLQRSRPHGRGNKPQKWKRFINLAK